jgi:acetyl-CoA synthetase
MNCAAITWPATARSRDAETGYFLHHQPHRRCTTDVSELRMGTMEIESAGPAAPSWWPKRRWSAAGHDRQAICTFVVVLKRAHAKAATEAKAIAKQLRDWVIRKSAPSPEAQGHPLPACTQDPQQQRSCGACCVPLTRAKAVMQDTSTLENPDS